MNSIIIPEWRKALMGYSFWFAFMGTFTFLIPFVAWEAFSVDLDPNLFAWAGFGFGILGVIGRFLVQPKSIIINAIAIVTLTVIVFGLAASRVNSETRSSTELSSFEQKMMVHALPLIKKWEGVVLVAYPDVIGVWTICSGTTRGVKPGMKKTPAECDKLLQDEALEYWRGVSTALNMTAKAEMTYKRGASWTSLAINIGIHAAKKSTATKRLNAGDIRGACKALTWFNRAGGKIYRGLTNRRTDEHTFCIDGVQT